MRWFLALVAVLVALSPVSVMAGDTVTIVAVPYTGDAIESFTATYVSATRVDLSWTYGSSITNVMVRAKYGSQPTDVNDGYLVYYGNGVTASDTSMNFDENAGTLYYRIWGETLPNVFNTSMSDNVEGVIMMMLLLFGAGLVALIAAYVIKRPLVCVVSAAFWLIGGFYAFTISAKNWAAWDIYLALTMFGLVMAIVALLAITTLKEKAETLGEVLSPSDAQLLAQEQEEMRNALNVFTSPAPQKNKRRTETNSLDMTNFEKRWGG